MSIDKKKSKDDGEIKVERQLKKQLSGEIAMSMVTQDKNQEIQELLASNPNVATEIYEVIQKDSIDIIMEELLQEAFNYRHEAEDGRKYKALVIKKEDFER